MCSLFFRPVMKLARSNLVRPAPRLQDADLDADQVREAYWQVCRAMRVMYARCRLVHGDLSEYNVLWHGGEIVVIDVSQSVEHDHPRASEFLRKDCLNVNAFFGEAVADPIDPLSLRELFDALKIPKS